MSRFSTIEAKGRVISQERNARRKAAQAVSPASRTVYPYDAIPQIPMKGGTVFHQVCFHRPDPISS
jgi:hypothetical protein